MAADLLPLQSGISAQRKCRHPRIGPCMKSTGIYALADSAEILIIVGTQAEVFPI
jgi:hypothetical protein